MQKPQSSARGLGLGVIEVDRGRRFATARTGCPPPRKAIVSVGTGQVSWLAVWLTPCAFPPCTHCRLRNADCGMEELPTSAPRYPPATGQWLVQVSSRSQLRGSHGMARRRAGRHHVPSSSPSPGTPDPVAIAPRRSLPPLPIPQTVAYPYFTCRPTVKGFRLSRPKPSPGREPTRLLAGGHPR